MPKNWLDSVKQAIEYGGIKSSDTIEGLAKELGLDPTKLANTVKAWNTKAAAGKVDAFGRLPQNMKPIVKTPFYGIKTGAIIGQIFCGPRVNYKFEVLDKELNPIPGLYAVGSTAGGTSGGGVFQAAVLSSLGLAFSSGWIAGDNATVVKPSYAPAGMVLESDIRAQEIFNKFNKYFPRIGSLMMKIGFSMKRRG
jgi:fumarate reductase flavoprotein subunit